MSRRATRKFYAWICIIITILSLLALCLLKLGNYGHANSYNDPYHEKYSEYFNDVQQTQITAARKYGIKPIKDREAAKAIIRQENLVMIKSCRNYKVAQLRNSIPYLT